MKLLFALLLFFPTAHALDVVERLQEHLKTEYALELETQLGRCAEDECLIEKDGHWVFKGTTQEVCFPYTECGFYHCMEKQRPCSSVGVGYFTELAKPTCENYVKNIGLDRFSPLGREWIYEVMVCLQKGLVDECELQGQCNLGNLKASCDYIVDFTLKFHPGCYLESGVGVCQLPFKDQRMIWKTVLPYLTGREWIEAFKVVLSCAGRGDRDGLHLSRQSQHL